MFVCGLVCSINFWVYVRYKFESLIFFYLEVFYIFKFELFDIFLLIYV